MPTYNEPAWKIDVINEINRLIYGSNRYIRHAGGEYTIAGEGHALYPDVLLFRDTDDAVVLQGWELKFPDTSIDDSEFINNAIEKAERLGLNSFLLWNVTFAKLYILVNNCDYQCIRVWTDLCEITRRSQVHTSSNRWKRLLAEIINDLNDRFSSGQIQGRPFVESFRSNGLISFITSNQSIYIDAIRQQRATDPDLDSRIDLWWRDNQYEYGQHEQAETILSRIELINWAAKFLFAHLLKQNFEAARIIDEITIQPHTTTTQQGLAIFERLSRSCDFWTIFNAYTCQLFTPERTWADLLQLHQLLSDLRIGGIDQQQIKDLLEQTAELSRRELHGQYTTPSALAQILVRLTLNDKRRTIADFCCGTGTILRAAINIKREYNISEEDILNSIWASDWYADPLQLASLSMASPTNMGEVIQLFRRDAFLLSQGCAITLQNPNNGQEVQRNLPLLYSIVSNLPFISQSGRSIYNNQIAEINNWLCTNLGQNNELDGRSDISAYFIFKLYQLLEPSGRLGIIITNAWLGTLWGEILRVRINHFFHIETVITSGAGKWFTNSDVMTNILILKKRDAIVNNNETCNDEITKYIVTNQPLSEWSDDNANRLLAASIHESAATEDTLSIIELTQNDINRYSQIGLASSALFVDAEWALTLPLIRLNSLFTIIRGERRGWNDMFYPEGEHGIEVEYLTPVLKSPQSIISYVATPDRVAFTCSRSLTELEALGHNGAISWIQHFNNAVNTNGRPLSEVLRRPNHHWYEMRAETTADLVLFINYGERLFVPKLSIRSFVDQRLAALRSENADVDLCHALLNSIIGLFWLEGMGFGRGLGALDLNKEKFERSMMILDPSVISSTHRQNILSRFNHIINDHIDNIQTELEKENRVQFDLAVLEAYSISQYYERIKQSLLRLFEIRTTSIN